MIRRWLMKGICMKTCVFDVINNTFEVLNYRKSGLMLFERKFKVLLM